MGRKPHVLVTAYPAQGHVGPLMKLAYKLAHHGIKVTFVNAGFAHDRIMAAMPHKLDDQIPISFVPISSGLESNQEIEDLVEEIKRVSSNMPINLQGLIENINRPNNDEQVCCVVADIAAWWGIEVAKKMGIKAAAVVPFGAGNLALFLHASKLIKAGIIDADGIPLRDELIYLSKDSLPCNTKELIWSIPGKAEMQRFLFRNCVQKTIEIAKISDLILINSFYELEQSAYDLIPNAVPIGPLFTSDNHGPCAGNLWHEDSTCLNWLDQQPQGSVIYAAFGSTAVCNQQQLEELAYAFELIGRPFLWVVRSNFTQGMVAKFPEGFIERVANYGKIVEWAPQEKVLAHPSTACFFSHCGWNSTIEGVSMGVPFLCWPYFGDQLHNARTICETWKIGVRVVPDENGIVTRHQIKSTIETLVSRQDIKANSLKLKQMAAKSICDGGSSSNNLMGFIESLKE